RSAVRRRASPEGRLLRTLRSVCGGRRRKQKDVRGWLMLGLSTVVENFGDALHSRAASWVQLALGVGLFALSFRFDGKRATGPRLRPRMGGPRAMVMLGLTAGVLEVATMVPYLAAVGIMTISGLPAAHLFFA